MTSINFFTSIAYASSPKPLSASILEQVDNYFYLGGKKAHVIEGEVQSEEEQVIFAETNSSLLARIGKVFSYFTIIIPLLMLITKAILRSNHNFKVINPKEKLEMD